MRAFGGRFESPDQPSRATAQGRKPTLSYDNRFPTAADGRSVSYRPEAAFHMRLLSELKARRGMTGFRKITKRDRPEALQAAAERHSAHLRSAIGIAMNRAHRSNPLVRELFGAATIEGLAEGLDAKVACVSFRVLHLRQVWHQLIPWEALEGERPAATATHVAWSLRESIRRSGVDRRSDA